uniref:Heparanase n=1 Tax=Anopheles atroparvus TaxID=41427 RepID=A0A182JKZ5_ANOAO
MASQPSRLGVLLVLVLVLGGAPLLRATENELPLVTVRQLMASVNTRRLANVLGDEFVSFSVKPQDIFDGQGNPICETSFLMAQSLGRTYLKVVADSSQLHLQTTGGRSVIGGPEDAGLVQIKASAWQAFYDWAQRAGVVPVFVLDYPTGGEGTWDAKRTLQVLSAASGLGIDECRWQLGNGNVVDGPKYWDDLRTFRTMLKAFPKQRWGVVACELNPNGPLEEMQYFHVNIDSLVDAITITKPLFGESSWNYSTLQREVHLRGLSKQRPPLWLDLQDQRDEDAHHKQASCDERCLREGLEYARILGEAARGGVSAVFKPVHRGAIQQYTLDYLTALLYKRTVGNRVFPVQQGPQDATGGRGTSVYAYCTRNVTGSVTLVVVNEGESEATNATIKLTTRALSSPVELFLVSVHNGQPMVNNRAFPDGSTAPELVPVTAVTTLANGVSFYVPAQTILFAIVPGVQVRECRTNVVPSPKRRPEAPETSPHEPAYYATSTDVLLQELIGALLEQSSLEPLQRKRRAVPPRATLAAASEKRKRFLARFAGTPPDGDLAEGLAQALAGAQPEPAPTERSARGPRQTQAYKRQQRRVRQKEKRVEKRNLRRMKHPLLESQRERTKRGGGLMRRARHHPHSHRFHERLLKRMSAKLASRKTKRSSLAEAVNEPPSFGASEEDLQGRSGFPLGDVHLVISKTAGEESGSRGGDYGSTENSEDLESVEYRKPDRRSPRHRAGVRRRITISKRDFHRFGLPEVDSGEEVDCKYRRRSYRREDQEMEAKETKRIDRYFPIEQDRSRKDKEESYESSTEQAKRDNEEPFTAAQSGEDGKEAATRRDAEEEMEGSAQNDSSDEQQQEEMHEMTEAAPAAVSDEMQLFTPAPRNAEERPVIHWNEPPQWSLESTSAEVAEVPHRRYKRRSGQPEQESAESREVERLEDFFRTNAKLQQKFAEMFDLLLEAIEELESEENDAKEDVGDEGEVRENEAHSRTKRNALLHPQSWESRERSNMIHQRREESVESKENPSIPVVRNERADSQIAETMQPVQPGEDEPHDQEPTLGSDEGKPGAFMLRTVVNFVRRATTEFHQLFSGWFKKTS